MSPLGHPLGTSGSNAFACTAGRVLFMALVENAFGIEGGLVVLKAENVKKTIKFPPRQVPGYSG